MLLGVSGAELRPEDEDMDLLDYQCIMENSFSLWGERHLGNLLIVRHLSYPHAAG